MAYSFLNGMSALGRKAEKLLIKVIDRSVSSIEMPRGLTKVGANSFAYCYSLKEVILNDGLKEIGVNGLYECRFTTLSLPDSMEILNSGSLADNPSCESFYAGAGLQKIYASTFRNWKNCLIYDFSKCLQIPSLLNSNAFSGINADARILVPAALYDSWISATNWSAYEQYIEPFGYIPSEGLNYGYEIWNTGEYTVMGRGSCTDSEIVIPSEYDDGVNGKAKVGSVEAYAFFGDEQIESLVLPESGSVLYGATFANCANLKQVRNVQYTNSSEFANNASLELVTFLDGHSVWGFTFQNCGDSVVYDFSRHTSVASLDSADSITVGANSKIIVPPALLEQWRNATNWSAYYDHIVAAE